jgi:small ligand-binding sensory domain FIST
MDSDLAVQEALREAKAQMPEQVDWGLIFFSATHIDQAERIRQILIDQTSCPQWAGCSAAGVLTHAAEIYGEAGLVIMLGHTPELEARSFVTCQRLEHSPSVPSQLREFLEGLRVEEPLFLFFPDAFTNTPYNFINTFQYTKNRPQVFGAGACDDGAWNRAAQLGTDETLKQGVAGLSLVGQRRTQVGVTQSALVLGEPMFVTKASDSQIVELDGQSALQAYVDAAVELGFPDIETAAQQLMLSFPLNPEEPQFVGEATIARHLTGIDVVTQALQVPQLVREGDVLSFALRNRIAAEEDLENMLARLWEAEPRTPDFGFYFNCAARGIALYGEHDVDLKHIQSVLGEFPLIGFFGAFELAQVPLGLQLYSYTGVLVLVYL